MQQAECRRLVQRLAEAQELAEFEERAAKTRDRQRAKYGKLAVGTATKTVVQRVAGEWVDREGTHVGEDSGGRVCWESEQRYYVFTRQIAKK